MSCGNVTREASSRNATAQDGLPRFCANQTAVCENAGAVFGIITGMEIEQVYREVAPKLQSYLTGNGCSYATACDIVQETFLRLWKRKDELSDDLHQVSGLAFTIARNYRNDLARKAQHEVFIERDEGSGTREEGEVPRDEGCEVRDAARPGEAEEEGAALRRRLKASLGRMPVELLETFALSRLGKLTVKDIASGTGASEANVKVRVHRAKEMLGKVMKCGVEELRGCEVEKLRGARAERIEKMVRLRIEPLLKAGADKIVLGCTHYRGNKMEGGSPLQRHQEPLARNVEHLPSLS